MKGIYFDTSIVHLSRWPTTPTFRHLSLIQDPIPSFKDLVAAALESGLRKPEHAHAQPIVFFKLSCLSTLAASPVAAHISAVRLRIPGRSILTSISTASTGGSTVLPATHSATLPKPFPALEHLDISTTYVNCDAAFQGLLKRHPGLRYLVVDRTGLISIGNAEVACVEIGKVIASVGVSRSTEAMKVYRAAARAQQARLQQERRQRELRDAQAFAENDQHQLNPALQRLVERDLSAASASRRGRSSYASERRDRRGGGGGAANGMEADSSLTNAMAGLHVSTNTRPIILPSAPSLISLACGVDPHSEVNQELRSEWEEDFATGFEEGIEKVLQAIQERLEDYHRLRARAQNATHKSPAEDRMQPRLYRFRTPEERQDLLKRASELGCRMEDLPEYQEVDGDVLASMDLIPCEEVDARILLDQVRSSQCTLCTLPDCAAEGRIVFTDSGEKDEMERRKWRRPSSEHKPGCAHIVARQIWEDALDR